MWLARLSLVQASPDSAQAKNERIINISMKSQAIPLPSLTTPKPPKCPFSHPPPVLSAIVAAHSHPEPPNASPAAH